jgi:hypothetical protein
MNQINDQMLSHRSHSVRFQPQSVRECNRALEWCALNIGVKGVDWMADPQLWRVRPNDIWQFRFEYHAVMFSLTWC